MVRWAEGGEFLNTCISPGSIDMVSSLVPGPVCSPTTQASQGDGTDHLEPPAVGSLFCPRYAILGRVLVTLSGVEHRLSRSEAPRGIWSEWT